MLYLYNTALWPLRAAVLLWAGWNRRDPRRAREWNERLGRAVPQAEPGGLWLHGSSVGEARIVRSVARALRERRARTPLAVSATTRTGRGQLPEPPAVEAAFFAPLDLAGVPGRVLDALRPAALALVETELWPNLVHESANRSVAVGLINGRLSPARMSRYRRLAGLYRPLMQRLACVGAQSEEDAARFLELGVRREALEVTGNVKYDLAVPDVDPATLRAELGLGADRPVLIAGSTGAGEDELVLQAAERVRRDHPDLYLILAPRHPERAGDVERVARERGFRLARSSRSEPAVAADGLLVDTIGQLATLYVLARVAFVGGSLVPVGGHNVLEPAAAGVPVLFGPHTEHVAEPARTLLDAGAAVRVADADGLAEQWLALLRDAPRARRMGSAAEEVVRANRGALLRTVTILDRLLEASPR